MKFKGGNAKETAIFRNKRVVIWWQPTPTPKYFTTGNVVGFMEEVRRYDTVYFLYQALFCTLQLSATSDSRAREISIKILVNIFSLVEYHCRLHDKINACMGHNVSALIKKDQYRTAFSTKSSKILKTVSTRSFFCQTVLIYLVKNKCLMQKFTFLAVSILEVKVKQNSKQNSVRITSYIVALNI